MSNDYKFYSEGVFYRTEKEFMQSVVAYCTSPCSDLSIRRIINEAIPEILMNMNLYHSDLTNADFKDGVFKATLVIYEEARKISNVRKHNVDLLGTTP